MCQTNSGLSTDTPIQTFRRPWQVRSQRQIVSVWVGLGKAARHPLRVAPIAPGQTFVQPIVGFHVDSVHSIPE